MAEQHFFQSFFGPQQPQIQQPPEYIIHNEAILEVVNNWEHLKDLINRFVEGKLNNVQVDRLDQDLFNYIARNKIDITKYTNEQEFLHAFWRIPEK